MPVGWGLAIGGAASLIGGVLGGDASKSAANTQAQAANNATALQRDIFQTQQAETQPYRDLGNAALPTLASYLGLDTQKSGPDWAAYLKANPDVAADPNFANNPAAHYSQYGRKEGRALPQFSNTSQASKDPNFGMLTKPFTLADVPNDPGYQFATQQANTALENSALARGGALSGNFATALQQQNQNMGFQKENQAFNQYWQQRGNIANLLGQATGLGQSGVGQSIGAGNNAAAGISSTIQGAGNAQAAGTIGQANAISGALGGIGSLATQYPLLSAYSKYLNQGTGGGANADAYTNMANQAPSNYPINV